MSCAGSLSQRGGINSPFEGRRRPIPSSSLSGSRRRAKHRLHDHRRQIRATPPRTHRIQHPDPDPAQCSPIGHGMRQRQGREGGTTGSAIVDCDAIGRVAESPPRKTESVFAGRSLWVGRVGHLGGKGEDEGLDELKTCVERNPDHDIRGVRC